MVREMLRLWLTQYSVELFLFFSALSLTLTAICLICLKKSAALKSRYRALMMGREGINIEELLTRYGSMISDGLRIQKVIESRMREIERQLSDSITGVGLVRFNAFQDTGSDLSFSLALLDRKQNGVVLTSIFGREDSRCYGKPIRGGLSSIQLSEEEMQALSAARMSMEH
ncbi:MAG: DUF4446 family protein [Dethiobacter sp.]|jgi:hypothetical protein|nr:DUF4446 family protein [Dethiobacter sp.]